VKIRLFYIGIKKSKNRVFEFYVSGSFELEVTQRRNNRNTLLKNVSKTNKAIDNASNALAFLTLKELSVEIPEVCNI
jgi:hypothetical protein